MGNKPALTLLEKELNVEKFPVLKTHPVLSDAIKRLDVLYQLPSTPNTLDSIFKIGVQVSDLFKETSTPLNVLQAAAGILHDLNSRPYPIPDEKRMTFLNCILSVMQMTIGKG